MPRKKPSREIDVKRLAAAVAASRRGLRFARQMRRDMVAAAAGPNWAEDAGSFRRPVNLLWSYQQIMARSLVPKSPRVLMSTFDRAMKATVGKMQAWANPEIEAMNLAAHLRRWVIDALYSFGVFKVAIGTPADAAIAGWTRKAGDVSAGVVDLDDWVGDQYARCFEEMSFEGHRIRVPIDAVKDSSYYGKARNKLEPQDFDEYNEPGDERVRMLGVGHERGERDEFLDYVELWEVYCPWQKTVVTLACDQTGLPVEDGEPLREQEWVGIDTGPYHHIGFGLAPGNLLPVAPMQNLFDLDDAVNVLYRKLIEQARRQKTVLPTRGADEEDVQRLASGVEDGFAFRCDNPDSIKEVSVGGPHQPNAMFGEQLRMLFDDLAGGLRILSGAGPQSKTATQDKLLNQNASAGVADMQETSVVGISNVLKAMGWLWWHHPRLEMVSEEPLPNYREMSVVRNAKPEERQRGRWRDVDLRVDPYSLRFQSPAERLAGMVDLVTKVYMPMAQVAQSQGVNLDLHYLFKKFAEYQDQPDLQELLTVEEPPAPGEGPDGGSGSAAKAGLAPTERRYVRENVPMRTDRGDLQNRMNAAAGVNPGGDPRPQRSGYASR